MGYSMDGAFAVTGTFAGGAMSASTPATAAPGAQQVMQCMEVWGGNVLFDGGVVMAGLDAWVYSRPYRGDAGGGDVYFVSSCATGRITRLLVADVSGHGRAVQAVAEQLRALMRRYVNHIDQCHFVQQMSGHFGALAAGGSFATSVVTTFFSPTNRLTLCNAGHPPPLLYRARAKQWSILDGSHADGHRRTNLPLGLHEDGFGYEQFDVALDVGDLVLCYTDALSESRDASGELLGPAGLLTLARGLDVSDPAAVVPALLGAITQRHAGNLVEDDVTVLLFRPNGLGSRVPLRDKLLAPLRVLRGVAQSLARRDAGPAPWPELSLANIGGALLAPLGRLQRRGGNRPTSSPERKEPDG